MMFQRQNIFSALIIPGYPGDNMSVYMEPLIDDLLRAWGKGYGHMTELQRPTSKCEFGTCTHCMTCWRMGCSAAGVSTESSHAQFARQLSSSSG
ncbi:putative transposase protein [Panicum miliaceum]|uniref:Transposase protein n=1 Tax=Panicum miliaceum TaxID=4540 RepID=A0A3L6TIP5_PANMI|nr:putative transposase protein [Panicum miliaceum]